MLTTYSRWFICDWSVRHKWKKVASAFDKMALLEIHDTVDITEFSQLSRVYRLEKEELKQEWAEIESDFVSAGPRPEKEGIVVSSDVKVANNSASPEERLPRGQIQGDKDGDAHNTHSNLQQSSCTPLGRGSPLPVQR